MKLLTTSHGDILVVKPMAGSISYATSNLGAELAKLVKSGNSLIALDMSGVEMIDSMGMSQLIVLSKLMRGKGCMVLFGIRDSIMEIIRVSGLNKLFPCASSKGEAIAMLRSAQTSI